MEVRPGRDDGRRELTGTRDSGTWGMGVALAGPWVDLGSGCRLQPRPRPGPRPLGGSGAGSRTEGVEDSRRVGGALWVTATHPPPQSAGRCWWWRSLMAAR